MVNEYVRSLVRQSNPLESYLNEIDGFTYRFPLPFIPFSLYLVFLSLNGALQLVQLVLQLTYDVCLCFDLVVFRLALTLQQGALHLCLEEWRGHTVSDQ